MRCKALYLAAWAYADAESPCNDLDLAVEILKRARTELSSFAAPTTNSKATAKNTTSVDVSPSLRKMLDAQKKEIETLMRKCTDSRKRQQAAGKKRWSAAFEKNAKDPEAGLPPPKPSPSPVDVAEQAKLEHAFRNEGIKMPDGTILGGANLMGGGGSSQPLMTEIPTSHTNQQASRSSSSMKSEQQLLNQHLHEEEEEEEHEDDSLTEHLLGAAAIAGVAAAIGFGLNMWFKKRT